MRSWAALVGLCLIAGCSSEPVIEQVGYFKSDGRDRVFTARMSEEATETDALKFAEDAQHTTGQMTAVYIYEHDADVPSDRITQASNVQQVNRILELPDLSPWRYAYMRYRQGNIEFVDCSQRMHELCRGG